MNVAVNYRRLYQKIANLLNYPSVLLLLLFTLGLILYVGLNYFNRPVEPHPMEELHVRLAQQLKTAQHTLNQQKHQISQLKNQATTQITALQLKIGELHGQVNRLNAFSQQLAQIAKIPNEQFNFSQIPATGGSPSPAKDIKSDQSPPIPHLKIQATSILHQQVDHLLIQLNQQQHELALLESILLNHNIEQSAYPTGRPVHSGWLSSYFGIRKDPFTGLPAEHKGLDFAGKKGNDIIATASGVVTWSDDNYGYGLMIEIDHGGGYKTRYGHNDKLLVTVGEVVEKGQVIAKMGSSGRSTGPHVHYEILKDGKAINPIDSIYSATH